MADPTSTPSTSAIVAYYAETSVDALDDWVSRLQESLAAAYADFEPRSLATVHSTLVGLDVPGIDLPGLAARLRQELASPLPLQFGGYADDGRHISRGQTRLDRSVVQHGSAVIAIGWPAPDVMALDRLRRIAEEYGVRHRYPLHDGATDPDAHMVIGALPREVEPSALRTIASATSPCVAPLRFEDLRVVTYDDPTLPLAGTSVRELPRA